jgi:hypothetical protein
MIGKNYKNLFLAHPVYERALSASDHHRHGSEILTEEEQTRKKSGKADDTTEVNLIF